MLKQTPLQPKQLQESDVDNNILPKIKQADVEALCELLKPIFKAKISYLETIKNNINYEQERIFVISDLGCGEGQMLFTLLELLKKNLTSFLELKIKVFACDAKESMLTLYKNNFALKRKASYMKHVSLEETLVNKLQDTTPRKSDLILASHSFYYCREKWDTNKFSDIHFNQHILTKLLTQLKKNGCIAVILQSNDKPNIQGKYCSTVGNHEDFENIMYPLKIKFDSPGAKIMQNDQRENFANAEMLASCLEEYQKQLIQQQKVPLSIQVKTSIAIINLGIINFELNSATQKYTQSETVTKLLNFYTRGLYNSFKAEEQKKLLDFIKNKCTRNDDTLVMCHVNKVFVICPSEKLIDREESELAVENMDSTNGKSFTK